MSMDWMLQPVTQVAALGAVLGVGLLGSLALWVSVKIEMRASRKEAQALRSLTEATINGLRGRIEELRALPPCDPVPSTGPTTVQGLNLTTRTKALRMYHRGETIPLIAAALGVPKEEVELLLKLDHLLKESAA